MADETVDKTGENAGAGDEAVVEAAGEDTAVSTTDAQTAGESTDAPEGEASAAEDASELTTEPAEAAPVAREAMMIKPDVSFVKEIIKGGGSDVKKCYQCATCSVVCNLTPDDSPFPRKEMMWAQWGLKDKLMGDPDVWLCHQCSDCVAQCPRGAKPGRVLQAIAKMTISRFSPPAFLGKAVGSPSAFIVMAALPMIILAVIIGAFGDFTPGMGEDINHDGIIKGADEHEGNIVYSRMMPILAIDLTYSAFFFLAIGIFAIGVKRYWGVLAEHAKSEGVPLKSSGLSNVGPVLTEIITHKRFGKCDETEDRKSSHLILVIGFILLFLTTALSVGFHYLLGKYSPYPQIGPVKILGNTGAIAGIVGIGLITINRFKHQEKIGLGSYFDWQLISVILVIMVTGILAEVLRLANVGVVAFPTYFLHLTAVLFLFAYAPFSKMAHMVYRTVALIFARVTERDMGVE